MKFLSSIFTYDFGIKTQQVANIQWLSCIFNCKFLIMFSIPHEASKIILNVTASTITEGKQLIRL